MRELLTHDGLPFTDVATLADLRPLDPALQLLTRYVTVYAVNTARAGAPASVDFTLATPTGEVQLPLTSLPRFSEREPYVIVLERFPVRGPVALRASAAMSLMLFGFTETDPGEDAATPEAFVTGAPLVAPYTLVSAVVEDGERVVHVLSPTVVHEVSLVIDVPAGGRLQIGFVTDTDEQLFAFEGPLLAFQVLDRIPMRASGRITAQRVAGDGRCAVYGTIVRR